MGKSYVSLVFCALFVEFWVLSACLERDAVMGDRQNADFVYYRRADDCYRKCADRAISKNKRKGKM